MAAKSVENIFSREDLDLELNTMLTEDTNTVVQEKDEKFDNILANIKSNFNYKLGVNSSGNNNKSNKNDIANKLAEI